MKKLVLLYAFLLALLLGDFSFAQGLSIGNNLQTYNVIGDLVVTCESSDFRDTQTFTCRDTVLEPASYAYFIGAKDNGATSVQLVSTRNDGSTRSRSLSYNSATGKSSELANLWMSTLLQRPLLKEGKNVIEYTYFKGSQPLNSGKFDVEVGFAGTRTCQKSFYTSRDANDCRSPFTVCQKYFEQFSWCK